MDDTDRALVTQKMTHLEHKVELALHDRHVAHQLLQKRLYLMETRVNAWKNYKIV